MIALAVPDISHWYFGRIAKGVEETADARNYGLVICSTANADPRREKRYFNMLKTRAADGLVYTASRSTATSKSFSSTPGVGARSRRRGDPSLPHLPSVRTTLAEGTRAVGNHLASLGHRRAVMIGGYPGLHSTDERVAAFRELFPTALTLFGDFEQESGARIVSELLANGVPFTCIFAHNDSMALGAIRGLRDAGLRVPEDVLGRRVRRHGGREPGDARAHDSAQGPGRGRRRAAGILIDLLDGADEGRHRSCCRPS